jgi:ABC-type nitrate/sulfonate/bicarbonate transport system substrate-binding protein
MAKILFGLLITIFLASVDALPAEKIRISVSGGYNMIFLSAGVAQHRGFFKDEGLDADIIVMGATPSIAALTNGDIDFTLLTGTVVRAAIRGLPVRLGRSDDQLAACVAGAPGNQVR